MSNLAKFMALALSYVTVVLSCVFLPSLAGMFAVISFMFAFFGLVCVFGGINRNESSTTFFGVAGVINFLVGIGLTSAMPLLTVFAACAVVLSLLAATAPQK